jgi:hypothetical protein
MGKIILNRENVRMSTFFLPLKTSLLRVQF